MQPSRIGACICPQFDVSVKVISVTGSHVPVDMIPDALHAGEYSTILAVRSNVLERFCG